MKASVTFPDKNTEPLRKSRARGGDPRGARASARGFIGFSPRAFAQGRMRVGFLALLAVLMLALAGPLGCEADCGDSCDDDDDCGGSLVCYSSQCAPKKCRSECSHVGINRCSYNRLSCDYLGCD